MRKVAVHDPEGFADFWCIWRPHMRHTDGKTPARAAFIKALLNGALPQDIIDGASGYIRFMPEKDKPYIQLAQTWLNNFIFENWCDRERAFQARISAAPSTVVEIKPNLPENHFSRRWAARQSGE